MASAGGLIHGVALVENGAVLLAMALVGGDETDGAVTVLAVTPTHETGHPGARGLQALEALLRP